MSFRPGTNPLSIRSGTAPRSAMATESGGSSGLVYAGEASGGSGTMLVRETHGASEYPPSAPASGTMLVHGGTLKQTSGGHGAAGAAPPATRPAWMSPTYGLDQSVEDSGVANGDRTMVVHDNNGDASGTMVIKPAAASFLGAGGAASSTCGGAGTMLLVSAHEDGGGKTNAPPTFMRHMFGDNATPTSPMPSGGGGVEAKRRSSSLASAHRSSCRESTGAEGAEGHDVALSGRVLSAAVYDDDEVSARIEASGRHHSLSEDVNGASGAGCASSGGGGGGIRSSSNRRTSGGERRSARGDISAMGIDTLSKELYHLSADMERDIGKVYRKYERLERTIRAERDRKMAELNKQAGYVGP